MVIYTRSSLFTCDTFLLRTDNSFLSFVHFQFIFWWIREDYLDVYNEIEIIVSIVRFNLFDKSVKDQTIQLSFFCANQYYPGFDTLDIINGMFTANILMPFIPPQSLTGAGALLLLLVYQLHMPLQWFYQFQLFDTFFFVVVSLYFVFPRFSHIAILILMMVSKGELNIRVIFYRFLFLLCGVCVCVYVCSTNLINK